MSATRILFRADASVQIGTGHVMRCLTLADALRDQGTSCHFLCRPHPGNLIALIAARGHAVSALPPLPAGGTLPFDTGYAAWLGTDPSRDAADCLAALADAPPADWLVVDHYALDAGWEAVMRPHVGRVMVIDDLADRPHVCDLLLDQNLGRDTQDYNGLLPSVAVRLIGPGYTLMRPDFATCRAQSLARRVAPRLGHLLITMGGVDKDNATGRVLGALAECRLPDDLRITAVLGPHAPAIQQVRERAAAMPWPTDVRVGVTDMPRLMADADLAIGSGGGTTWERLFMQLPTLVTPIAGNQLAFLEFLSAEGYVKIFRHDVDLKGLLDDIDLKSFRVLETIEHGTGKVVDLLISGKV